VPVRDAQGVVAFVVASGTDVTQQRRIERALKDSERQFRLLWERSNDGMRILDVDGTTLMINEAFARMLGRRPDEMIGKPFWEVYGTEAGEAMRANWFAWDRQVTNPVRSEQRVQRPDGSEVWLDVVVSHIEVPGRGPLTLTIARDVTTAKRHS